jgi:choline-sulfatase
VLAGTAGPDIVSVRLSGPGCNAYDLKDRDTAAAASAWLRRAARRGDAPFLLAVGLMMPHPPYVCDPEDYAAVAGAVAPPALPRPNAEHPWLAEWRASRDIAGLPQAMIMRARRAYYGLVRRMDALIGELLATLRASGLAEDTIVIYLSDHGDHLGERGLFWKHTFFDESSKVPLIVSAPSRLPSGIRRAAECGGSQRNIRGILPRHRRIMVDAQCGRAPYDPRRRAEAELLSRAAARAVRYGARSGRAARRGR